MIAGYLERGELISDCAAINIRAMRRDLLAASFVAGIKRIRAQFSGHATQASTPVYRLLDEWFDIEAHDTLAQQTIQQTIDQWARLLTEAAFDDAIAQDWISAWFEKLEESRGLMHNQQNGIVCRTGAKQHPFRHVMILGLDRRLCKDSKTPLI